MHFFSYVMVGDSSWSAELRKLIAQCVSNDPLTFNTAFLGQDNSDYCNWILNKDNWGGIVTQVLGVPTAAIIVFPLITVIAAENQ